MKIFIIGDSRCSQGVKNIGDPTSWTALFIKAHPEFQFVLHRYHQEHGKIALYSIDKYLEDENLRVDLTIVHTGYNERVEYFTPKLMNTIFGKYYDSKYMVNQNGERYSYAAYEPEAKIYHTLRKKSGKVIYIGHPCFKTYEPSRKYTPSYDENARRADDWFASLSTDYIDLPQTLEWHAANQKEDGIHPNDTGARYIVERVSTFL